MANSNAPARTPEPQPASSETAGSPKTAYPRPTERPNRQPIRINGWIPA